MSDPSFYSRFEADFRGSRDEIMGRLEAYLPFVVPLLDDGDGPPRVIDLGCGRGEWLELTLSLGMSPHGVDLDEGMLQDCRQRGFSVANADAIATLLALPDASHAIVSGFHIAEHLPFEALQELVAQAHRVLRPGGLLILETPNAENISVGTLSFHMDPTHIRPLPPGLLSFLPRYHGFVRTLVVRLQESPELHTAARVRLIDVVRGPSPDYAVVAQKAAAPEYLKRFDPAFRTDYGLTLETLAERFEQGFIQDIDCIKHQVEEYQERLTAMSESTSWRITAPLRAGALALRGARLRARASATRLGRRARSLAGAPIRLALRVPLLRRLGARALARFPRVAGALRRLARPSGASQGSYAASAAVRTEDDLSPKAKAIFSKLADKLKV